jgi:uncharacterized protein
MNVQRFESWPGSHALIDAVWSVRSVSSNAVMTCRSVVNQRVGDGYDALVDGHRQALLQISTQVAAAVKAMAAANPQGASSSSARTTVSVPPCPSTDSNTGTGA